MHLACSIAPHRTIPSSVLVRSPTPPNGRKKQKGKRGLGPKARRGAPISRVWWFIKHFYDSYHSLDTSPRTAQRGAGGFRNRTARKKRACGAPAAASSSVRQRQARQRRQADCPVLTGSDFQEAGRRAAAAVTVPASGIRFSSVTVLFEGIRFSETVLADQIFITVPCGIRFSVLLRPLVAERGQSDFQETHPTHTIRKHLRRQGPSHPKTAPSRLLPAADTQRRVSAPRGPAAPRRCKKESAAVTGSADAVAVTSSWKKVLSVP